MTQEQLGSLLYQALAEPIGLMLQASDRQLARQRLYAARAKLQDPALALLQFRFWPQDGEAVGNLVICRGGQLQIQGPRPQATDDE